MDGSEVSASRRNGYEHKQLRIGQRKESDDPSMKKALNALAQKEWRLRLKSDPDRYAKFREADNVRVKGIRDTLSDEQRERYNEKARERMARYRQRQRENGIKENKKKVTRATSEKKRKEWRDEKRVQRENMSSQKRRRINEKRREVYAQKKESRQEKADSKLKNATITKSKFPTDNARRQAVHRTIKILPKDPNKFAEVLSNVIAKTTPTKKAALSNKCIISPQSKKRLNFYDSNTSSTKEKLKEIKKKRNSKDNRLRYLIHQAAMIKTKEIKASKARQFGLSRKILTKVAKVDDIMDIQRKKRKDALSEKELDTLTNFFHQTDVSREMPNPRQVNKAMEPRKTLDGSLVNSYEKFQRQNPEAKVSYSKFVKCRPKNVKPVAHTKYNQCLCEYCTNVELKVNSLVRFCSSQHIEPFCKDKYEVSRLTLCQKENGFYKKQCIDRKCMECGVGAIEKLDTAVELIRQHGLSDITWQSWTQEVVTKRVKGKEVTKRQMTQRKHTTTVQNLIEELANSLKDFSKHLFNAQWQAEQFEKLKANIPDKWVLFCSDFGENYICRQQDEAQSAHWSYDQVTLHPVVAYYRCLECGAPMHEIFSIISDDHKHDHHAVHHYTTLVSEQLMSRGLSIDVQIQFSDGAPTQYKSKVNFADMSLCQTDLGFHVEKHFFGSRHGKGPCDGEVGVLKRCIITGVKSRQGLIRNASEFFQFAKNKLSIPKAGDDQHVHKKRTFMFVEDGDVKRSERNARLANIKAVKDTRTTHCFRPIGPYIVTSRERSCFCEVCIDMERREKCLNEKLTGNGATQTLRINRRMPQEQDDDIHAVPADGDAQVLPEGHGQAPPEDDNQFPPDDDIQLPNDDDGAQTPPTGDVDVQLQLYPEDNPLDIVSNSFSDEEGLMDTSGLSGILENILGDDEMQLSPIISLITEMGDLEQASGNTVPVKQRWTSGLQFNISPTRGKGSGVQTTSTTQLFLMMSLVSSVPQTSVWLDQESSMCLMILICEKMVN
ncbi:uncharacterized protein LOC117317958 [Pecten maximus]|uniref:uncharacterized protein LOC117317958 n=1 Tax=Pecten maximus TaxID=6579 RepID=UPI001457FB3D|nr:uncharacterized protein LOC117317958 [Pecten maximus]